MKKIFADVRYDASKTELDLYLDQFEINYKKYNNLGRRIHNYWTKVIEEGKIRVI